MDWIENKHRLLWTEVAPANKQMPNASSAYEQHEFVSSVVVEMLEGNAIILLPPCEKPMVVSYLGVVRKREMAKFRLTLSLQCVNRHMGKEGLQV
jgi:chromosome condensin MukBEF complex kleisin-like MukF subunit